MEIKSKNNNDRLQIVLAMACSLIAMVINYMISFFLTPYITNTLGTEAYGFVSLAKTVANYGLIITSCLNAYASRFIAVSYHEGDIKRANSFYSSVVIADVILIAVSAVISIFLAFNIRAFFSVPDDLLNDVRLLFYLDILNCMVLALASVYTVSGYIKNRLQYISFSKILAYCTEALILVVFFRIFKPSVWFVGAALLISTVLYGLINYGIKKKMTPDLRCRIDHFSFSAVKELLGRGLWSAFNQIGNMLNTGLDLWITNLMLDGFKLGQLSIVKTVATICSALPSLITQPFQPMLLKLYADKDMNGVRKTISFQMKLLGAVSCIVLAGFFVLGESYFELWTPNNNSALLNRIAIITLIGFVFESVASPMFFTYTLSLKNTLPCIVTAVSGALNVLSMFIFLKFTGLDLYAVVGTTTVLGLITFFIFTPLYSARCIKLPSLSFYKPIVRIVISDLLTVGFVKIVFRTVAVNSWIGLIGMAAVVGILGLLLYSISVFDKDERAKVLRQIKRILCRQR